MDWVYAPLVVGERDVVEFRGEEARQFRRTAAVRVMRSPPAKPSPGKCPVRPQIRELWQAQGTGGRGTYRHQQVLQLGLGAVDVAYLPAVNTVNTAVCDAVAVHQKSLQALGPGSLSDSLPHAVAIVEQQSAIAAQPVARGRRLERLQSFLRQKDVSMEELQAAAAKEARVYR